MSRPIGVIADTHGRLRPEALQALQGVERILHLGDVGSPQVLEELQQVAPVEAVRGNVDREPWAQALPLTRIVELPTPGAPPHLLYLLHDLTLLDLKPEAAGFAAVLSGHSHRPGWERRGGVLYLNPGSAGPRRFQLPVSLAYLHLLPTGIEPEIVLLEAA